MNSDKFNKILSDHQQRIYSLALYILRDKAQAQDITQDVFTRLWKDFEKIDLDKTKQWLSTVTRNACIDKIRRRKEYTQVEDNHQVTHVHQEPAGHLALHQLSGWLKDAIACLKEPYSSLIILCDVQQTSQDTAAQTLDLSTNQVKVYLHRARRELRCLLKEHTNEQ